MQCFIFHYNTFGSNALDSKYFFQCMTMVGDKSSEEASDENTGTGSVCVFFPFILDIKFVVHTSYIQVVCVFSSHSFWTSSS